MGIESWSTTAASNNSASPAGAPEGWEWVNLGYTHTYASASSFTIASTDYTATYAPGRRIKAVGSTTGTIYGTIATSAFATNTTVTVNWDDGGTLQSETLTVSLGIHAPGQASSSPYEYIKAIDGGGTEYEFTDLQANADYVFHVRLLVPATDAANLGYKTSTDNGSTYAEAAGNYGYPRHSNNGAVTADSTTGTIALVTEGGISNVAADGGVGGKITFLAPNSTGAYRHVLANLMGADATPLPVTETSTSYRVDTATAINAVKFLFSAGNITSGTIEMWKLRHRT
jgi:hypothetical protein